MCAHAAGDASLEGDGLAACALLENLACDGIAACAFLEVLVHNGIVACACLEIIVHDGIPAACGGLGMTGLSSCHPERSEGSRRVCGATALSTPSPR